MQFVTPDQYYHQVGATSLDALDLPPLQPPEGNNHHHHNHNHHHHSHHQISNSTSSNSSSSTSSTASNANTNSSAGQQNGGSSNGGSGGNNHLGGGGHYQTTISDASALIADFAASYTSASGDDSGQLCAGYHHNGYQYHANAGGQHNGALGTNNQHQQQAQHQFGSHQTIDSTTLSSTPGVQGKKSIDKGSDEYKKRRERNNVAVRKSREKAKMRSRETERRVAELSKENQLYRAQYDELRREFNVLKSLLLKTGLTEQVIEDEAQRHTSMQHQMNQVTQSVHNHMVVANNHHISHY